MVLWWICIMLCTVFSLTQQKREWVTVETKGQGSFVLTNEYGIVPSKLNSVVFHIKACSDAIVVISDITSIKNTKGHYFLAMIGKRNNRETQVFDSCFTCDRTVIVKGPLLDCKVFKPFWLMWDGEGLFKLGQGTVVGKDVTLTLQGTQGKYMVNFIQVTSTNGVTANFKFHSDTSLKFFHPAPDGSTKILVNETQAIDVTLLEVKLIPQSQDVQLDLYGEGADYFYIHNRSLRLAVQLDFETKRHYTLHISSNVGVAATLTVSVVDENDETPSLAVLPGKVPQGIPAGIVIGGFYNVVDLDKGDNLTYTLSGNGSADFLALGQGLLKVMKPLPSRTTGQYKHLTLTVTDLEGHSTSAELNIAVIGLVGYNTNVKSNAAVARLVEQNTSVKLNATANPTLPVSELAHLKRSNDPPGSERAGTVSTELTTMSTTIIILTAVSGLEGALGVVIAILIYKKLMGGKKLSTVAPETPDVCVEISCAASDTNMP